MKVEELIKYRDAFNDKLLVHQKKNKKWTILMIIGYIIGFLFVLIPFGIVGGNQGLAKPLWHNVLVIIGIVIISMAIICTCFYIYHLVNIKNNKKYKELLSHELTTLVMKHRDFTEKEFPFIKKS